MRTTLPTILSLLLFIASYSNAEHKVLYLKAFEEQHQMLNGKQIPSFQRAVFLTENAFYQDSLNYDQFSKEITTITDSLKSFITYWQMGTQKTAANWAVFTYMTEPDEVNNNHPYSYDFEDYFGDKDMTKMFVTKLLKTKTGNCHSLPYLYKILCEAMGANAHLALTPNHIYIKHLTEQGRWTNVELTNATFPKDKWIIKDMGLSKQAKEKKLYMNPLTQQQSIALTIFDLSNAYEAQFGIDSLYLSMVDTALVYFPKCIALWMSKANYYQELANKERSAIEPNDSLVQRFEKERTVINQKIKDLGHEDMPIKLYRKWLKDFEKEKAKADRKKKKQEAKLKRKQNKTSSL